MQLADNVEAAIKRVLGTIEGELLDDAVDEIVAERPLTPEPMEETNEEISEQNTDDAVTKEDSSKRRAAPPPGYNIYYREGQNLDSCLVANSAKRVSESWCYVMITVFLCDDNGICLPVLLQAEMRRQRRSLSKIP